MPEGKELLELKAARSESLETIAEQQARIEELETQVDKLDRMSHLGTTAMGDLYRPDPVEDRPDTIEMTVAELARLALLERAINQGLLPQDSAAMGQLAMTAGVGPQAVDPAIEAAAGREIARREMDKVAPPTDA